MFQTSSFIAVETGWQLLTLACLVGTATIAGTIALCARAKAGHGATRFFWIAGAIVVCAFGAGAVRFILAGIHQSVPTVPIRASLISAIAFFIIGTALAAAFVDRRMAQKNALLDTALNNMNHGLMMFDENSRVILCN